MDPSIEEARALVSDPALWPPVRDFLWHFVPQIHPSWIEGLKIGGPEVEEPPGGPRVGRFILEALGIEPFFHAFPKDDGSRLALLDGATLLEIAKWLGALAFAPALRRVTDGATVRALKAELAGVYPDVFSFTAYFGELKGGNPETERPEAGSVVPSGMAMLLSALPDVPPLVSRLKFKLPKPLAERLPAPGLRPPTLNPKTIPKLLKLRFPEAHSLCC